MSSYSVNILPLCIESEKDALLQRCLEGLSMATGIDQYYGHKRAFDVEMSDRQIIISGGQLHIKGHSISIVTEDYPRYESQKEEWLKKFNLLVLYCDTRSLLEYRDRLAIIRNTMHSRNRSSEVLLFLANVDDVMNIITMPTERQTLIGVYSALSPMPFCTTALKDTYSNCTLDSSYWQDQQFSLCNDHARNRHFQIPRGVICDFPRHAGYSDLLMTIIQFSLSKYNIRINKPLGSHVIINQNNNQSIVNYMYSLPLFLQKSRMANKLCTKRRDKKTIRMAVIGDTSSGKTFFLQDFCVSLDRLGADYLKRDNHPFASYHQFKDDIYEIGYKNTVKYACCQRNHYVGQFHNNKHTFKIEFLDIPGEIFELEKNQNNPNGPGIPKTYNICGQAIDTLNSWSTKNDRWFEVTCWNNGSKTIRVVTYKGQQNRSSSVSNEDSGSEKNVSQTANNHSGINGLSDKKDIRQLNYPDINDYLSSLERSGFVKDTQATYTINGKELLNDFFAYDAPSVYHAVVAAYQSQIDPDRRQTENVDHLKSLYFFVFLLHATDIVLCQRCYSLGGKEIDTKSFATNVEKLQDFYKMENRRSPHFYLAFKGADLLLNRKISQDLFKESHNDINFIYSLFCKQLNDKLFDGALRRNEIFDRNELGQFVGDVGEQTKEQALRDILNNNKNLVSIIDNQKSSIRKCVDDFKELIGDDGLNSIPIHTYFCSTPIDRDFVIDQFVENEGEADKKIKGASLSGDTQNPIRRLCFGTLQLTMDILDNAPSVTFFPEGDISQPGEILSYLQGK